MGDRRIASTGDSPLRILVAGLVGLLCCLFDAATAQDVGVFKILKLEGHHVRWQGSNTGAPLIVTYQIVNKQVEFPGARNCRKIGPLDELAGASDVTDAALRAELAAAFAMWEAATNIRFKEAPEGTRADILIGAQIDPEGWAFADVFYNVASPETVKPISRALICLNPVRVWKIGFDGDLRKYDLRYTFAHEIGHAIGLDHPAGGDQMMGYRYDERFRTLQSGDIRGAVALYGEVRHAGLPSPQANTEKVQTRALSARRFAKRWGSRGFNPRSP